jgi:phage-related minor tail protein
LLYLHFQQSAITRKLYSPNSDGTLSQTQPVIQFSMTLVASASETEMRNAVPQAAAAVERMTAAPSLLDRTQNAIDISATIVDAKSIAATWDPLMKKLEVFTDIVDGISEVRRATGPYLAHSVLLCQGSSICQDGLEHTFCNI